MCSTVGLRIDLQRISTFGPSHDSRNSSKNVWQRNPVTAETWDLVPASGHFIIRRKKKGRAYSGNEKRRKRDNRTLANELSVHWQLQLKKSSSFPRVFWPGPKGAPSALGPPNGKIHKCRDMCGLHVTDEAHRYETRCCAGNSRERNGSNRVTNFIMTTDDPRSEPLLRFHSSVRACLSHFFPKPKISPQLSCNGKRRLRSFETLQSFNFEKSQSALNELSRSSETSWTRPVFIVIDGPGTSQRRCFYWKSRMFWNDVPRMTSINSWTVKSYRTGFIRSTKFDVNSVQFFKINRNLHWIFDTGNKWNQ